MTVTLVREAGREREHPRFRIPVKVEIQGWNYPVREWSIDGFSVRGVQHIEVLPETIPVKFNFRFDGFSAVVDLDVQIVHRSEADKSLACRFYELSEQQLAVLRAVINAYLAGEFVAMGDLIQVVSRDRPAFAAAENEQMLAPTMLQKWIAQGRRIIGMVLLVGLFAGLFSFTVWMAYQRLFVVEAPSAMVSAPLVIIRSPQPGFFESLALPPGKTVDKGDAVAFMELVGGGAVTLDSPCTCQIIEYHALARQFVALGEPLLTLLPVAEKPYISAQIEIQAAKKISIGDTATIRFADEREVSGSVRQIRHGESLVRRLSAPLNNPLANVIAYHEIIIESDAVLPPELLGSLVSVVIDTF